MPSTSQKQHNLMAAVANNPDFAKKAGIPQKVGKDFVTADKGNKFGARPDLQGVNKPETHRSKQAALFNKGGQVMAKSSGNGITNAKMGSVRTAAPSRDGVASKGKTKGTQIKMAAMGKPLGMKKGGMSKMMKKGGKAC